MPGFVAFLFLAPAVATLIVAAAYILGMFAMTLAAVVDEIVEVIRHRTHRVHHVGHLGHA